MAIQYLKGDATNPQGQGQRIIIHVCNDIGKWGRGFVLAISKRWPAPERTYKSLFQSDNKPSLGDTQFVQVEDSITVANIIGQHGVRSPRNKTAPAPIRYDAIEKGLTSVANHAIEKSASVHMPRIGCGLAGGSWGKIEPIIERTLTNKNIKVFVYDF
ncbi:Appr-1-p processing protein [Aliikangiella sp. IMCC44359]|uniref:Appr-1-p processing protein n=1 Tax=Aliikangiella sp. IMCC44359 TaxID=3459125 RepID=UPI00403AFA81